MRETVDYLLRMWRDGERQDDWRASLTNVHTRDRINFASLEALQDFLEERAARTVSPAPKAGGTAGKGTP